MGRPHPVSRVGLADVQAAAQRIEGAVERTPLRRSQVLSSLCSAKVWLKFENLQFTSSFKERGALNRLLTLSAAERKRGVVAASAGNHAQAVAYHGRRLGIGVTIVVPSSTPFTKISNTEVLGAEVVQWGESLSEAAEHARKLAQQRKLVMVHPYDDPLVVAGQGTVALEMLAQREDLEVLLVPAGGGGLLSGVATAVKAVRPRVRVVGVGARRYPALHDWFHHKQRVRRASSPPDTLADGIAVKDPSALTHRLLRRHVDDFLLVDEEPIEDAINALLEYEKTVVEGAGAASLAALMAHPTRFKGRRVGCILSGGNIDSRVLADTILRGLARSGRLCRVRLALRDLPGALARIAAVVAQEGGNIVDIRHQRVFSGARERTEVEIELATRDRRHARRVFRALHAAGYPAKTPD